MLHSSGKYVVTTLACLHLGTRVVSDVAVVVVSSVLPSCSLRAVAGMRCHGYRSCDATLVRSCEQQSCQEKERGAGVKSHSVFLFFSISLFSRTSNERVLMAMERGLKHSTLADPTDVPVDASVPATSSGDETSEEAVSADDENAEGDNVEPSVEADGVDPSVEADDVEPTVQEGELNVPAQATTAEDDAAASFLAVSEEPAGPMEAEAQTSVAEAPTSEAGATNLPADASVPVDGENAAVEAASSEEESSEEEDESSEDEEEGGEKDVDPPTPADENTATEGSLLALFDEPSPAAAPAVATASPVAAPVDVAAAPAVATPPPATLPQAAPVDAAAAPAVVVTPTPAALPSPAPVDAPCANAYVSPEITPEITDDASPTDDEVVEENAAVQDDDVVPAEGVPVYVADLVHEVEPTDAVNAPACSAGDAALVPNIVSAESLLARGSKIRRLQVRVHSTH